MSHFGIIKKDRVNFIKYILSGIYNLFITICQQKANEYQLYVQTSSYPL